MKKVYHLTIVYDTQTDEVEYIEETLDNEERDFLGNMAEEEGLDKQEIVDIIYGLVEPAEA